MGNLGWFPLWLPDQERGKITAGASDAPRPEGVGMVGRMFTADGSFGASTLLSCLGQDNSSVCFTLFELAVPPLLLFMLSASTG